MLRVTLNGQPAELDEATALDQALVLWGHEGGKFAVAVNGDFIPRSQYDQFTLQGGESIEVLSPMQGG